MRRHRKCWRKCSTITPSLPSFAKNYKTGETIPSGLVDRMNAADAYGRAGWVRPQLLYSTYALQFHDLPPAQVDLDALLRQDFAKFRPASFLDGDHLYAYFVT